MLVRRLVALSMSHAGSAAASSDGGRVKRLERIVILSRPTIGGNRLLDESFLDAVGGLEIIDVVLEDDCEIGTLFEVGDGVHGEKSVARGV